VSLRCCLESLILAQPASGNCALAPVVAQAAQDAVFMAMGDGVDIPPEAPT
jgi:hypothetical protein